MYFNLFSNFLIQNDKSILLHNSILISTDIFDIQIERTRSFRFISSATYTFRFRSSYITLKS